MFKKFVIIATLLVFIVAFLIYLKKEDIDLKEVLILKGDSAPVIEVSGFIGFNYDRRRLTEQFSGGLAEVFSPNKVEISEKFLLNRYLENSVDIDSISAESAIATFTSQTVLKLFEQADLVRAELFGNVKGFTENHNLTVERATFERRNRTFSSIDPVKITSFKRLMEGRSGFIYYLDSREIKIPGQIEGYEYSENFENNKP